jgi:tetratricopeptide (TPR) repeat protein
VQFNRGQYQVALPTLKKYAHLPHLLPLLLSVLEFNNNYLEAISYLNNQLAVDSLNANLWARLGSNYFQTDKSDSAVFAFTKALSINPLDQITANKLANLYVKLKEYKLAIDLCDTMLQSDSLNRKFILTKGLANFKFKKYLESEKCFSFLAAQGDTSFFVMRHLGISQLNIGDNYAAIEQLEKANAIVDKDVEVNFCLAKAYAATDTPGTGLFYIDRADSLMQPNAAFMAALYMEKSSIYEQLGDYNSAIECIKTAYDYNPKPEYLFFMASTYQYQLNNDKKALDYYTKFLDKLPPLLVADTSSMAITPQGGTLNMRKMAERNATAIKEELFFNQKQ